MKPLNLRRLAFIVASIIAVLIIPTFIDAQDFPPIPHPVEDRADCLVCHETGVAGATQIPEDHAGRTNATCQACHQLIEESAPAEESVTPETSLETPVTSETVTPEVTVTTTASPESSTSESSPTATSTTETDVLEPTATPTETAEAPAPEPAPAETGALPVPHTLTGRENCLVCHVSPEATAAADEGGAAIIPHTLVGREDCLACHETGIGGAPEMPADHAGRENDTCQACHQPGQMPAAPTSTASTEPLPTPLVYPQAEDVNTCLDCHATLDDEEHVAITTQWQRSVHSERNVGCADCHGGDPSADTIDESMSPEAGYIGVPAKGDIPALCASCHADVTRMRQYDLQTDQYAKYQESTHGIRLAEGDPNVATCFDCHGGHQTLKANDPASSVYPVNVPAMCASCHADQELMAPYNIPTNQFDLYRQSVHGHALLDNQDFRAPTCAVCHGTHGAAPPGYEEVANVCGSCHAATQDHYLKSPHADVNNEEAPKCVTCHGRYDVTEPTEALYLGAEPRHCGACHAPDSPGGQVAQTLYDTITTASETYEEADDAVEAARELGMLVSPLEGRLREANTSLITARAAQHTLNVDLVQEQAASARDTANEVKSGAESAIAESIFRRQAMVIAVAFIGLTIAALYLLKRELDRQLEEEG